MYCPQREANHRKREIGMNAKHCDPVLLKAWEQSSDASGFMAALSENGYQLAKGRRLVVVDPHGNVINPVRSLGLKSKELLEGLQGLDADALPSVNTVLDEQSKKNEVSAEPKPMRTLPPELTKLQEQISELKGKLRASGALAKCFGIAAYRKRKLVAMRQRFKSLSTCPSSPG